LPIFLVPNTSITMTSTINQCQMLNEPIIFSLRTLSSEISKVFGCAINQC
jgi:hypothetical protein